MAQAVAQPGHEPAGAEVFTLPETAAYLRVSEEAVLELVEQRSLPAQRIGEDWRFLKQAVVDWLRFGSKVSGELRMFPPAWTSVYPFWEELAWELERRIRRKLPAAEQPSGAPGSKQAVLKHFGVFKDDDVDVEEQLARIRARREAAGG